MKRTVLFYLFALACLMPAMLLRDFTPPNELRYLSIADEALARGHFFAFTNHGVPYADKPPLFLWLLMLVRLAPLTFQHLLLGMLSVVPAFVSTEVMAAMLTPSGKQRMLFRLMLLTSALMLVSMLTLRMDMLMMMFILLAVREFYRCYTAPQPHESVLLPICLFLSVFTKGALGLFIPLAIIVSYLAVNHRLSWFFRILGLRSWLLLVALFALWFGAVALEGGGAYLYDLVFHQTLGRAFHSFHHKEPFFYYLYMVWPLLLPWTFLAVAAIIGTCRRHSDHSVGQLMAVGSVATFGVLSLVSSKLSIYLLPFVPFAIAAAVPYVFSPHPAKHLGWTLAVPYFLFSLALPTYAVVLRAMPSLRYADIPWLWGSVSVISLSALVALFIVTRGGRNHAPAGSRAAGHGLRKSIAVMSVGLLLATATAGCSFGRLNPWIGYGTLCQTAKAISQARQCRSFLAVDLKNGENMEVYLGISPQTMTRSQLLGSKTRLRHVIVMAKQEALGGLPLKDVRVVGECVVGYLP